MTRSLKLLCALSCLPALATAADPVTLASPLFDRATLTLPGGKKFVVNAKSNGPQRPYIHRAQLNGAEFDKTYLEHSQITGGGELTFEMGSAPDYKWGTAPESRPASALGKVRR